MDVLQFHIVFFYTKRIVLNLNNFYFSTKTSANSDLMLQITENHHKNKIKKTFLSALSHLSIYAYNMYIIHITYKHTHIIYLYVFFLYSIFLDNILFPLIVFSF